MRPETGGGAFDLVVAGERVDRLVEGEIGLHQGVDLAAGAGLPAVLDQPLETLGGIFHRVAPGRRQSVRRQSVRR